jgi:nicotinamide-nucleotide adenylyltransferase
VTIRADSKQGSDERGEWGTAAEQRATIERLQNGVLEDVGGKRAWAANIEIDEGDEAGKGVSSTRVRTAVKEGDWETVSKLCTPRVAAWVREEELYIKDD